MLLLFFLLSVLSAQSQNFGGTPSSIKWLQINSQQARVIFPSGLDSQANRIANIVRLLNENTAATIGGKNRKWNIILQNQTTVSNAYVRLAPVMSEFYMMPPQNSFSNGSLRWDDNLVIHENRHMQQMANFNKGFTKVFSLLLGQEGQLLANGITIPDYFFEGDAVWQETLVSAQGRGRMPAFYNDIKSLWIDNKKYSWMKLRNGSLKDLTPNHYSLGYMLTAYGYEKYGQQFWKQVTNDAVKFRSVFYGFNRAIERYSGKSYKDFRNDALLYFKQKSFPKITGKKDDPAYITKVEKNNVVDYLFPYFVADDSILVVKKSYKQIPAFYFLVNGKEKKIRVKDIGLDDYFSYKNGKVVYAAYQSDARWANRNYSVIKLLNIHTGIQKQLTFKSKYFSPDINATGTEIIAVHINANGTSDLCRINAITGKLILKLKSPNNYFITQPKYIDTSTAVAAVRNLQGSMVLMKINLQDGSMDNLTNFTFNVIGYPYVKGDTVYFSAMNYGADKIFAVSLNSKKIFRITDNINGVYYPCVDTKGNLLVSANTSGGSRLALYKLNLQEWKENKFSNEVSNLYFTDSMSTFVGEGLLYTLNENIFEKSKIGSYINTINKYRKTFSLFNFHSWRPIIDDPEFGYSLYSDNTLSNFKNTVSYTYNRSDKSHTVGINSVHAGWFPVLGFSAEESFNRTVDTAINKQVSFNAIKLSAGISIPLNFIEGLTYKQLNFGGSYNLEQYYYKGAGKNVLTNHSIDYINAFINFSNYCQQALQQINPRWAQTISVNYRDAVNYRNSFKLVGHSSLYFPGIFPTHSFVVSTAYQVRDTLPDLFSKNFSYSRGYEALSTRRMFKLSANYHFPLFYPDWGFANILFFQRIRLNAFYDYTSAKAKLNNLLSEIKNRSAGGELYFDSKLWNSLPVTFGVRFSHLFDKDLLNQSVKNRWEIIVPIALIPD